MEQRTSSRPNKGRIDRLDTTAAMTFQDFVNYVSSDDPRIFPLSIRKKNNEKILFNNWESVLAARQGIATKLRREIEEKLKILRQPTSSTDYKRGYGWQTGLYPDIARFDVDGCGIDRDGLRMEWDPSLLSMPQGATLVGRE